MTLEGKTMLKALTTWFAATNALTPGILGLAEDSLARCHGDYLIPKLRTGARASSKAVATVVTGGFVALAMATRLRENNTVEL